METQLNVSVVDDAVAEILIHPETHDQEFWGRRIRSVTCTSTMCLAGHIVAQAGWKLMFSGSDYTDYCTKGDEVRDIETLATEVAGLDEWDANRLFHSFGDAEDVAQRWKKIKEEHGL